MIEWDRRLWVERVEDLADAIGLVPPIHGLWLQLLRVLVDLVLRDEARFTKDVAVDRGKYVPGGEFAVYRDPIDVERIRGEPVVVDDAVVERGQGPS